MAIRHVTILCSRFAFSTTVPKHNITSYVRLVVKLHLMSRRVRQPLNETAKRNPRWRIQPNSKHTHTHTHRHHTICLFANFHVQHSNFPDFYFSFPSIPFTHNSLSRSAMRYSNKHSFRTPRYSAQ